MTDIVERLNAAAEFFEQPPPPTLVPPDEPLNKLLRAGADEIERLRFRIEGLLEVIRDYDDRLGRP